MSTRQAILAYHPEYLAYDFGPDHPLRPERLTAGLDLLERSGLLNLASDIVAPERAEAELALAHDEAYIRAVREAADSWLPGSMLNRYGLSHPDNPAFPGMHEAAARIAGGSVEAMRRIMRGEVAHAFNPGGGLHHAARARASGFCVYNDAAVAIATAAREVDARVLYVDFDCHHGDGVQWIFYEDPRVLTISFHESGNYLFPGTGGVQERGAGAGQGFAINVPLAPNTDDASWIEAVEAVLPAAVERFHPDVIVSLHGADTHIWDPLTHLALTTTSFQSQARMTHELAHAYAGGRWLALGSGGYDWRRVVPRSWSILWSEMTGQPLPAALPAEWVEQWSAGADRPFPITFLDSEQLVGQLPAPVGDNRATVERARALAGL